MINQVTLTLTIHSEAPITLDDLQDEATTYLTDRVVPLLQDGYLSGLDNDQSWSIQFLCGGP
jgi:hypothetical protein